MSTLVLAFEWRDRSTLLGVQSAGLDGSVANAHLLFRLPAQRVLHPLLVITSLQNGRYNKDDQRERERRET